MKNWKMRTVIIFYCFGDYSDRHRCVVYAGKQ